MSVIHINQISQKIKELFEIHIDKSDLNITDEQYEEKILTRCLAAYGIYCSIECSAIEAAQSVVDGGDDNGIDAIFYSPLNKKMLLVQSKFSKDGTGEPNLEGVIKYCKGIKDLFNMSIDRFNDKVKSKQQLIETAIREYDTKYEMILIDTCTAKELAVHATRNIEDLLNEMNNTGEEQTELLLNFTRFNQAKIFNSLALSAGTEPINIEIGLSQWGLVSEPYKAYFGIVSGKEIAHWWKNYNTRLFEKNIRQVLGTTDVNDEIEKTLKESPELFWYYNNGITIIADKIEKSAVGGSSKDIGSFKLTNLAIVNGAQTVSSIGRYYQNTIDEISDEAKVPIRMIQLSGSPENFDKSVTKANNRQNRIENRDFVSQDKEQVRIKTELSIDGIDYHIMSSENFKQSKKSFELIEATAALACTSGKNFLTVQAKGGIGKYFENLERGIYKELFNTSVSGYYVYNSVIVVRKIENILQEQIKLLGRYNGRDYGILVHGNRTISLIAIYRLKLKEKFNVINFEIEEVLLKETVINVVNDISIFMEYNYPDCILGTFFKNATKCNHLTEEIKNQQATAYL